MSQNQSPNEGVGFIFGFLGIFIFSLTLPATKVAITSLDPVFVGLGRAIMAALLSALLLAITRQPFPPWRMLPSFCIVIAGVVIGFPLLSAIAMQDAPASYGAVIAGLLPLATALCGTWRAGEHPSFLFWLFASLGSAIVIGFALFSGGGTLRLSDIALLGAVAAAGLGYAEGAVLSRKFGAWQVICWSLVLAAPMLLPTVLQHRPPSLSAVSVNAMLGFGYLSVFSMFLGFFAWYQGLSMGGIARVGQIQLLQPFLTMSASTIILGEPFLWANLIVAVGVILCVALGKRTTITASS